MDIAVISFIDFSIAIETLANRLQAIFDSCKDFFLNDGTSPKKYGMSRYEKKGEYGYSYKPYRSNYKPKRNLPYQRHIY